MAILGLMIEAVSFPDGVNGLRGRTAEFIRKSGELAVGCTRAGEMLTQLRTGLGAKPRG